MRTAHSLGWRRRLDVGARTVAAVVVGYAVAALAASLLARLLPMPRSEAVSTAMIASFAVYAFILLWAFAARSTVKVWVVLGGLTAILGAALWLSLALGGGRS